MWENNIKTPLERLRHELSLLKLDDALLFLNRLLASSRADTPDPDLEPILKARKVGAPAFIIHFLAKQLLLNASNLGLYQLDGPKFHRLMDLFFKLDDPIVGDPKWPTADPTGFFERMLAQQMPSQHRNILQHLGLGLGLFRDMGLIQTLEAYDIRTEIETALEMSVEEFMAMGFLCSALQTATHNGRRCQGTFNHLHLVEANFQGLRFCRPELWERFIPLIACDRTKFRQICDDSQYKVRDARYTQFEFNPLIRYPILDVGGSRYIAVDPNLVIERTTLGLFYDLFERDGLEFSSRFGYVFDRFVGNLLGSVCPSESLWWEADGSRQKPKNVGKVSDWVYLGKSTTVLFECKSLRPSLELVTYGSDESVQTTRRRIVSALEQLIGHANSIQNGKWVAHGLKPKPAVGVVVTYGRIQTVNGPFMRQRIAQDITDKGLAPIPHVVLSLEDLDHVIRLVELGHALDEVIVKLASAENSFNPLQQYADLFKGQRANSDFSFNRGQRFMDMVIAGLPQQNTPQCST
jgi:hypothetical protein